MFSETANFFVHNVLAAYKAYKENCNTARGSFKYTRHAIDLATALFHFREHLPAGVQLTRREAVARCPSYRLVADVVNASKHHTITRDTSDGPSLVASAADISERTTVVFYTDAQGEYRHNVTGVDVQCSDGILRNLDTALIDVLNFWIKELKVAGIIELDLVPSYAAAGSEFVRRDDAIEQVPLEIVKGLSWRQTFQLMRYDNATNSAKPIDLTGAQIKAQIYQPRYTAQLDIIPPDGGESLQIELELNEQESLELHSLKTDSEKNDFLKKVAQNRQSEISEQINFWLQKRSSLKLEQIEPGTPNENEI